LQDEEDEKEEASFSGIVALYYLKRNKVTLKNLVVIEHSISTTKD